LAVRNAKGAPEVQQENHYYPFGLTMTGLSYQNTLQTGTNKIKFQRQEVQDAFELGWYNFKWRMHNPEIGRFMTIDPLSEKYTYNSPYAFSENRVIDGFELEGLEVILFNPNRKNISDEQREIDEDLMKEANEWKYFSSTLITVWAHGNPESMTDSKDGGIPIKDGMTLNAILNMESDSWREKSDKHQSKKGMMIVLFSCRTGANLKNEDGSFKDISVAQKISASDEFKDVLIFAPDNYVYVDSKLGPLVYKGENVGKDDNFIKGKSRKRSDTYGNWNVFYNGKLVRTYNGMFRPYRHEKLTDIYYRVPDKK
jgi:RHS repeat-associated protein